MKMNNNITKIMNTIKYSIKELKDKYILGTSYKLLDILKSKRDIISVNNYIKIEYYNLIVCSCTLISMTASVIILSCISNKVVAEDNINDLGGVATSISENTVSCNNITNKTVSSNEVYSILSSECDSKMEMSYKNNICNNITSVNSGGKFADGNKNTNESFDKMYKTYSIYSDNTMINVYSNINGDTTLVASEYTDINSKYKLLLDLRNTNTYSIEETEELRSEVNNDIEKIFNKSLDVENDNILEIMNIANNLGTSDESSVTSYKLDEYLYPLQKYSIDILKNTNSAEYQTMLQACLEEILLGKQNLYAIENSEFFTEEIRAMLSNIDNTDNSEIETSVFKVGKTDLNCTNNNIAFMQLKLNNEYTNIILKINNDGKVYSIDII